MSQPLLSQRHKMLLETFKKQLQNHLPAQRDFLVALSGGLDSVVLLHLFSRTACKVRAVHVHHGLSPNADKWATFCATLCKRSKMPFILQKVLVNEAHSVEAVARAARYQAIQRTIFKHEVLSTAHHLDDQAETFLLALKRGSGVKGLSAMQAVVFHQHFTIFRPLLGFSKAQLQQYAEQHQLAWVEDESNQSVRYDRNFLRHEVLPRLNGRWTQFSQMVARSAEHCANQQQLLEELLTEELERLADFTYKTLKINAFPRFSMQKQQQLIRLWLEKCGVPMPSTAQLMQILTAFIPTPANKNPQLKLGAQVLRRYQTQLYLTREFADTRNFCVTLLPNQQIVLPDGIGEMVRTETAIFCKFLHKNDRLQLPDDLQQVPLTLKLHHTGKVNIYGKPHREEMKKLWQQADIPVWERSRTPLIFFHDELLGILKST